MAKKVNKKKKLILNIFFRLIAFVSIVVMLIFCMYLYKLDMIPGKYLTIIYISVGVIYLILTLLIMPRKIKTKIKTVAAILLVIMGLVSYFGIKYSDKTIEFLGSLSQKLDQKEEYKLMVLADSELTKETMKDKKIGVYKNDSVNDAVKTLKQEVKKTLVTEEYDDVIKMFDDLKDGKVDAVLINGTIENLLETDEFKAMELDLKEVFSIQVPVKGDTKEIVKVVDVTNTPFNIYIAGGDAYGSINKVMNTDVNMVVSVDVKNHKLLLTSIPRDYYVQLPGKGENAYDKLTHAGYYGVNESIKAVEKLLDTDINYYAKVNFSTIEKVIDAIGGITIENESAFRTNDGNFYYKKGNIKLNGRQALWYARERHAFKDGDIQRVKNQQKVLDAVFTKITSSDTLIRKYPDILSAISKSFSTNLDEKSIKKIVNLQMNNMTGWKIEKQNLVGTDGMGKCYSMPSYNLYVMNRDEESVKNAQEKIKQFIERKDTGV